MRRFAPIAFTGFALIGISWPALAQQQLIPAPYPSGHQGAHILVAPPAAKHQYMVPTPYPRTLGHNALGDPHSYHVRKRQKLVPTPYPRQYR